MVIVLATNRLEDIDPAVRDRMSVVVNFDLPNAEQCAAWWRERAIHLNSEEIEVLGKRSVGLSFRRLWGVAERVVAMGAVGPENYKSFDGCCFNFRRAIMSLCWHCDLALRVKVMVVSMWMWVMGVVRWVLGILGQRRRGEADTTVAEVNGESDGGESSDSDSRGRALLGASVRSVVVQMEPVTESDTTNVDESGCTQRGGDQNQTTPNLTLSDLAESHAANHNGLATRLPNLNEILLEVDRAHDQAAAETGGSAEEWRARLLTMGGVCWMLSQMMWVGQNLARVCWWLASCLGGGGGSSAE